MPVEEATANEAVEEEVPTTTAADNIDTVKDLDESIDAEEARTAAESEAGDVQDRAAGTAATADDSGPEIDETDLTRRANEAGVTVEDVEEACAAAGIAEDDPRSLKILEHLVAREERRLIDIGRTASPQQNQQQATQAQQQEAAANVAKIEKFVLKLKPEEYTPELVEQLNAMHQYWEQREQALVQRMNIYEQAEQQRQADSVQREFHRILDNAPPAYQELFGKLQNINRNSEEAKNREALWEECKALYAGYTKVGKTQVGLDDLANRAMRLVFGDRAKSTARQEIAASIQKRSNMIRPRPTQRTARENGDGTKKAVDSVAQLMRDRGMLSVEEDAGLPD